VDDLEAKAGGAAVELATTYVPSPRPMVAIVGLVLERLEVVV
jgi:hypothetical protein